MPSVEHKQRRASIPEIVGAWLHIWTPPRDARVPPVPWRGLAIGGAVAAVVLGAALAVLIPRIVDTKAENAARRQAERERLAAAHRARVIRNQRPHHGSAPALAPPAASTPEQREAARASLLERAQADILADARARAARGQLRPVTGPATCERAPATPSSGPIGVFDCFAVTTRIKASERNLPGAMGIPFRAVLDYRDFSYTWCKVEQIPGEKLVTMPDEVVMLPPACRAPRT